MSDGASKNRRERIPDPLKRRALTGLELRLGVVGKALARVGKARDPEAVHDVRVACRRLAAALDIWRAALPDRAFQRSQKTLRKIRSQLGDAREWEVHLEMVKSILKGSHPDGREAIRQLTQKLERGVARERRLAAAIATRKGTRSGYRALSRDIQSLEFKDDGRVDPLQSAVDRVNLKRQRALKALRKAVEKPDKQKNLHGARIASKNWRYAVECLGDLLPTASLTPADPLKRIQESLGAVHDLSTLRGLVKKQARRHHRRGRRDLSQALSSCGQTLAEQYALKVLEFLEIYDSLQESLPPVWHPDSPWSDPPAQNEAADRSGSPVDSSASERPTTPAEHRDEQIH